MGLGFDDMFEDIHRSVSREIKEDLDKEDRQERLTACKEFALQLAADIYQKVVADMIANAVPRFDTPPVDYLRRAAEMSRDASLYLLEAHGYCSVDGPESSPSPPETKNDDPSTPDA